MKILSWNILTPGATEWAPRRQAIWNVIRAAAPDFFCWQEPMHEQVYQTIQADLGAAYDLVGAGREQDDRFPDRLARLHADDVTSRAGGEWCPIFFRRDRYEIVPTDQPTTVWYHPDPAQRNTPGTFSPGASFPRIFTWSRFRDLKTGDLTLLYNTHLEHTSAAIRAQQAAQLAQHVGASLRPGVGTVVVGDFNDPPGSATIQTMCARMPRVCDERATWRGFRPEDVAEKIDFIFASKPGCHVKFDLLEIPRINPPPRNTDGRVSDHMPLVCEWA